MSEAARLRSQSPLVLTGGRPVLCVDDDAAQLMLLMRQLSLAGYACVVAEGGREALDLVRRHKPCLILLDLDMPGMDGLGFLARLRSMPDFRKIPVILQTAQATRENVLRSAGLGIRSVLTKPISREQLVDRVFHVLTEVRESESQQHGHSAEAWSE